MKKTICLLYIICMLCQLGCTSIYTSYRRVGQLHIIQTMGIDQYDSGVELSIASGKSGNVSATSMSRRGESISAAIRAMQSFSVSEDLFYSHIQYAVLGQDTAERGIGRTLDFVERAGQIRMDIGLFVIRDGRAKEFFEKAAGSADTTEILTSLERSARRSGESYVFSAQDIARSLLERNCAMACAIELQPTEGSVFTDTGELTAVPAGYALFNGENLSGFIEGENARAVALLLDKGGIGEVTVDMGRQVSLDVRGSKCRYTPHWEGGRIKSMDIDIALSCAIGELDKPLPNLTEADYDAIEAALEEKIRTWVLAVLETQRRHECDYLGLMSRVRQHSPEEFSAAEEQWPQALRDTEYNISVESAIKRDYDLHAPER